MDSSQSIFDRDDLKLLLKQHFPKKVSVIGNNTLETTIDDFLVLGPSAKNFKLPKGAHNYDYTPQIAVIISALTLIFEIAKTIIEIRKDKDISAENLIEIVKPQFEINNIPDDVNKEQLMFHIEEILKNNGKR